ncbi:antimicrobial peptide system SdpA family protein [Rhodococcus sp. OK611]|nr:antimicrobial peptide system SdpA family protein [Rhodococcus sp. OK611]SNX92771.1 antimicrobial peptide system protein, SdpA family [Rhodococcus sp. OK270]
MAHLFPQGWAFFTRSPQEESFGAFSDRDGQLVPLDETPHSSVGNALGLDRESRKQVAELTLILHDIKDSEWTKCQVESADSCRQFITEKTYQVHNTQPAPLYCGSVVVIGRTLAPWAYRNLLSDSLVDERGIGLDITCDPH